MWNELPKDIPTLEVEIVNKTYENLCLLRDKAIEKGLTVREFIEVEASHSTLVAAVRDELNHIEDAIQTLDEDVSESIYYGERKIIGSYFDYWDYLRWVNVINDLHGIVFENKGKWGVLQLSDGCPTIDSKKIIIRGDGIGD